MALSWNEIKDRALRFTKEWAGETKERAEKDSFWNDFLDQKTNEDGSDLGL